MPRVAAHLGDRPFPWTVQHCDYRLDNLLFGPPEAGSELATVTVVDWQTVAHGPGLADLSYFLGAGLSVEDRRAHEKQLVGRYADAMAAAGVPGLSFDVCWEGYRRHAFAGLIMAIGASMLVTRTDRGDDMFMAMANRHGRHALDVDAEALIPS
jgi:aminoglycoside phosphotransferase (APT) family kinase protein